MRWLDSPPACAGPHTAHPIVPIGYSRTSVDRSTHGVFRRRAALMVVSAIHTLRQSTRRWVIFSSFTAPYRGPENRVGKNFRQNARVTAMDCPTYRPGQNFAYLCLDLVFCLHHPISWGKFFVDAGTFASFEGQIKPAHTNGRRETGAWEGCVTPFIRPVRFGRALGDFGSTRHLSACVCAETRRLGDD